MGWTTFNKPKHISTSDYFRESFSKEPNHELLDIAIVHRTEAYMAVKIKDTGEIIAFVYMLSYSRGWYNFGYKDMTEFCGPNISNCPKRILDQLSPLDKLDDTNGWAIEWRKRCYAKITNRASKQKIKIGDIIQTNEKIEFKSGASFDVFKKINRNIWKALININGKLLESGTNVRFMASNFNYEVIEIEKEPIFGGIFKK